MLPLLGTACKPSMDVDRGLALSLPACRRNELLAGELAPSGGTQSWPEAARAHDRALPAQGQVAHPLNT